MHKKLIYVASPDRLTVTRVSLATTISPIFIHICYRECFWIKLIFFQHGLRGLLFVKVLAQMPDDFSGADHSGLFKNK